jgi:hypothetical protein
MAGVRVTIPGTAGMIEARKAHLAAAVQWQWNVLQSRRYESSMAGARATGAGDCKQLRWEQRLNWRFADCLSERWYVDGPIKRLHAVAIDC